MFNSFQKEVQDLICRKLSYIVVEKEGALVMSEGEELKYWAFVINGCLEIIHPTNESYNKLLHMGDRCALVFITERSYGDKCFCFIC